MKVKNTWLSRLLVKLDNNIWCVIIWYSISPSLFSIPSVIISEISLRSHATFTDAKIIEYQIERSRATTLGYLKYLYSFGGIYYVGGCRVNATEDYYINDTITVMINEHNPTESHIWVNNIH